MALRMELEKNQRGLETEMDERLYVWKGYYSHRRISVHILMPRIKCRNRGEGKGAEVNLGQMLYRLYDILPTLSLPLR